MTCGKCVPTAPVRPVGGPDTYWQTFQYDAIGNRTKITDHGTGALAGADATTTYTPKDPGTGLPHAVQAATVTGGALDGQKSTFAYDAAGNTKTRTIGATTQDLTWDDEGHLATLTAAGKTTSYQYDADGNRLITKDADGSQTLTLPGNNELKIAKDGTKQGVRYYTHEGETVAVRTSSGFSFLLTDHQGTSMAAVAMTTLAITRRKQLPFGELRAEQTDTIPGTRGYVGGTTDPTGLTHLGAREYDPDLGRFISVDPVIDIDDPQQMNAYAYANNRPITASDPDGRQYYDEFTGMGYGNTTAQKHAYQKWGYRDSSGRTTKKYRTRLASYTKRMNSYYNSSYYKKQQKEAREANHRAYIARVKAQAEARRKAAEAARRKKEDIRASTEKGNQGDALSGATDKMKKGIEYIFSFKNTAGVCVSLSGSIGFGGEAAGCFIRTNRPDGKTDYGLSGTLEEQTGVGAGVGGTLGFMNSNADSFDQIRGEAAGFGGTVGDGLGVSFSHRGTFGTRNSRGDIVHSFTAGFGPAAGVEGNFGSGVTGITRLFTW
ncbi:RHS repeat-associated core domain-containing protein [Streptomyces sp. NPDC059753]|uniref:RHS repeat-associated core domain-containing protein n=1 Tax=Streptomyces sp. NPDC059753 TaxID=3346933 RepID=UPI00365FF824